MNDYERESIPSGLGLDMHAIGSQCQQTLGGRFDWNEKDGGFVFGAGDGRDCLSQLTCLCISFSL